MSDLVSEQMLLFAGEAFAASALVMAMAWLGAGAKRASLRHLVWAAAFGALILLPLLAMLVPGAVVFTLAAPAAPLPMDVPVAYMPPPPESFSFGLGDAVYVLAGVWLAGVVLIALPHALAAFLLRRLTRDSDDHPFDASELPAGRCELRLSRGARGPLTWGVLRPVVLLPNAAQFWPYERLQAVLRHEFAHVQRRDGLSQMLASIACALYWPNPLVWLGARALAREAEIAADDAVIASGMTPSDYAGALLEMARAFRGEGLAALSMAAPSALPARVKSILASTSSRSGVTSMDVLKMAAIAVLATGTLVAARPSLAQNVPSAPPAAEATPATPPTPAVEMPVPPVPPMDVDAPPAPPSAVNSPDRVVRIVRVHDTAHRHVVSQIVINDRDITDALARVKPQLERDLAEFKAHEAEVRQMEAMRPQLNAEIKKALAEARAQIALVRDDAIRAKADAALARAQARIDQAAAREFHHDGRTIILRDGDDAK